MKRELQKRVILNVTLVIFILVASALIFNIFSKKTVLFEPGETCTYNINKCMDLTQSGAVYCVADSIEANATSLLSSHSCINFNADNIKLICLNHASISAEESIKDDSRVVGILAIGTQESKRNNLKIKGCDLQGWNASGVSFLFVQNSEISDISVSGSISGLKIDESDSNNISNVILTENHRGIDFNFAKFNKVFGSGTRISDNLEYGIGLFPLAQNPTDHLNIIKDAIITNNPIGIWIFGSNQNTIDSNRIDSNAVGVKMTNSNGNTINNSHITNLDTDSIGLSIDTSSTGNKFYNNEFKNYNNFDPSLVWPSQNIFYAEKTRQTNIMGGVYSGGNYWGDRDGNGWSQVNSACNDTQGDGICDNPFKDLAGQDMDKYPLSSLTVFSGCNQKISNCGSASNANEVYCLDKSINITDSSACLNINADNVVIDCKNYRFYSTKNKGKAIKISGKNSATIKNCYFEDLSSPYNYDETGNSEPNAYGIYADQADGLNLSDISMKKIFNGSALKIKNSNGIFISNLDIENTTHSGVYIKSSKNSYFKDISVKYSQLYGLRAESVENSYFENIDSILNYNGMYIKSAINSTFINSLFQLNRANGFEIESSSDNRFYSISSNINLNNGINLFGSVNNIFENLTASINYANGIFVDGTTGSSNNYFMNLLIESNNLSGIMIDSSNFNLISRVSSKFNGNGITIKDSKNNSISGSDFSDNLNAGAIIYNTALTSTPIPGGVYYEHHFNAIENSSFKRNKIGIMINRSLNNFVNSSAIESNVNYGILLTRFSNENKIFSNQIKSNGAGIFINCNDFNFLCFDNLIYNNYFSNIQNALINTSTSNYWNFTYNETLINIQGSRGFGGNFWSDYSAGCVNANLDGICDIPLNVSGKNDNIDYLAITLSQTYSNCIKLNSCGAVLSSGNCYELNASVSTSSGNCFNITSSNVAFDCQNNIIEGNNSAEIGINILSGNFGIKIKNCKVNNFAGYGIKIDADSSSIESGELNGNKVGISVNSNLNNITGTKIYNSLNDAIRISGQNNNLISLTISGTNSSYYNLVLPSLGNTNIIDCSIGTASISGDKFRIKESGKGEIQFTEPVFFTGNLNENIMFSLNGIFINSSNSGLNKSADIILYGVIGSGTRNIFVNGQVCNSTTNPSCTQVSGLDTQTVVFKANKAGAFQIKGYYIYVSSPEENKVTSESSINFSFYVSTMPDRTISNCTLLINEALEKTFNSTEIIDMQQMTYVLNIPQNGVNTWNISCFDSANQILAKSGRFNKTEQSPNPPEPPNPNPTAKTCRELSGTVCDADKTCSVSFTSASDSSRCCVGTCNSPAPAETCSQKSGTTCNDSQTCSTGSFTSASDSSRCCTGTCTNPTPVICDLMCKINKFFEDRNNLIIVLVSIGIIIILIILIFFYSFRNRSSDKIRIFQEQQKTFGGISPQFSPIQIKPVQPVIQQAKPAPQPKQNDAAARQKAAAINAARLSLRNYILKEMKKGISEKDIKDVLSKANWKEAEISTAMQDVKKFVDRKR